MLKGIFKNKMFWCSCLTWICLLLFSFFLVLLLVKSSFDSGMIIIFMIIAFICFLFSLYWQYISYEENRRNYVFCKRNGEEICEEWLLFLNDIFEVNVYIDDFDDHLHYKTIRLTGKDFEVDKKYNILSFGENLIILSKGDEISFLGTTMMIESKNNSFAKHAIFDFSTNAFDILCKEKKPKENEEENGIYYFNEENKDNIYLKLNEFVTTLDKVRANVNFSICLEKNQGLFKSFVFESTDFFPGLSEDLTIFVGKEKKLWIRLEPGEKIVFTDEEVIMYCKNTSLSDQGISVILKKYVLESDDYRVFENKKEKGD